MYQMSKRLLATQFYPLFLYHLKLGQRIHLNWLRTVTTLQTGK